MTVEEFIKTFIRHSRFELIFRIEPGGEFEQVVLEGIDAPILLARNAEALKAIEYIVNRIFEKTGHKYVFDCGGYRASRAEELRLMALTAAEKVKQTGRLFRFNPMESDERRILHLTVAEDEQVRTESEGTGSKRQVIIYPR
jgi:spoIIIJ-associated protein